MGGGLAPRGRALKRGVRGEDVLGWQQFLLKPNTSPKLRGFRPILTVDGIFGIQTARATAEFQRRLGLIADGVVGPKTFDAGSAAGTRTVLFLPGSPMPLASPNQVTVPVIPYGPPLPPPPGPSGPMGSSREISWKRLRAEGWSSADGVKAGLTADNSVLQSAIDGSGDYVYDEYRIDITVMPEKLTPEAFLIELARDLNGTIKSGEFDGINVFQRRAGGIPSVGEIIDIDIQGPDNGSVILGELTPTYLFSKRSILRDSARIQSSARVSSDSAQW